MEAEEVEEVEDTEVDREVENQAVVDMAVEVVAVMEEEEEEVCKTLFGLILLVRLLKN